MKIRKIREDELQAIRSWFRSNFLFDVFVNQETCFVAESKGELVACGQLVMTNAKYVLMEHLAVSPTANKITAGRGIIKLVAHMEALSVALGYKCILGMVAEDNLVIRKMHKKVFKAHESEIQQKVVFKLI